MPRYYVRLEPQGLEDEDGEELPGPEAVKRLADAIADDLNRNRKEDLYQRIVVTDVTGAVVYEAPLVLH